MRNFDEMKELVLTLRSNASFKLPEDLDMDSFIADIMHYIGSTDSELREGIYSTICNLVYGDFLSNEQLKHITFSSLDDKHLFLGIGETDTDTVFTRAFSSLALCSCLWKYDHSRDNPFLTVAEIDAISHKIMQYVDQERDYRGYVNEKGWAHSIAHIADTLKCLAFCVDRDVTIQILGAIGKLVSNKSVVYFASEDERLADAAICTLYASCYRGDYFSVKEMCKWLKDTFVMIERKDMPEDNNVNVNRMAFIKSLYAKVMTDSDLREDEELYKAFHDCLFGIVTGLYAS